MLVKHILCYPARILGAGNKMVNSLYYNWQVGHSTFPEIFESIVTSTNCKADSGPTLCIRNVSNLYIPHFPD